MDFFEQQHRARRNTGWILLAFLVAVAAIVLSINVVGGTIYLFATDRPLLPFGRALAAVPHSAYVITTVVVLGVIFGGTLVRLNQLSGGGAAVAGMVDARFLGRDTRVPEEKRLLNIVEEMALASGVAVPRVFVMDGEGSINAFAAGYSANEAVIVVTEGTLKELNRDQLQGVVAHEFSHILNGDMRLNVRLLGVIAGIVLIGSAGGFLMRAATGGRGNRGDARLFLLGVLLWLIGSVGVLAGRLIKAAVSREREFLADASAVQFTRSTDGIGGALFKIARRGSVIMHRHAEELSHMCIGSPVGELMEFSLLRTHPPVEERMERLLGPQAVRLLKERSEREEASEEPSPVVEAFRSPLSAAVPPAAGALPAAAALLGSIGNPTSAHVDHARRVLDDIPEDVRSATGDAAGAKTAVLALLVAADDTRVRQLALVRDDAGAAAADQCARFADALAPLGPRLRFPVLSLALPTLKALPQEERERLLALVRRLIEAHGKVSLGEFVLQTILNRTLGAAPKRAPLAKYKDIPSLARESAIVLSLFAHAGKGGMFAFNKGMEALGITGGVFSAPAELRIDVVDAALNELKQLAPLRKPAFIKACVAVVMADAKLALAEGELLRAVCAALDSPLPPIIETELETTEAVA
ncbi:MAG TPA: M48 family metalloprotease [Burkholderiales bacterium]|nr:M48 family metalloprotease [Burkholderiales bacterium]